MKSAGAVPYTYLEVDRLEPPIARIRYRGAYYYFNFKKLPDAFEGHRGPQVHFPATSAPVLGGIDVPAAFRPKRGARLSLALYDRPAEGARIVVTVTSSDYLDTMGIGEGTLLASVYQRANRWSLLRFIDGRMGWLAPADAGKYMSLESLITDTEETYITLEEWDRKLAPQPGARERFDVPSDPRRKWMGWLYATSANPTAVPMFVKPDRTQPDVGFLDLASRDNFRKVLRLPAFDGKYVPIVFSRRDGWIELGLDDANRCYRQEAAPRVFIEDVPGRWDVLGVSQTHAEAVWSTAWAMETSAAVRVLETRRLAGTLWLRIKVFMGEACERAMCDVPEVVLGEGWLPAHDKHGRSIVWFETYCD